MLTTLSQKKEVDSIIRDTIDKVLVLRFGRESDPNCLHLNQILSKAAREVSKFATVALVDVDSPDIQVYVKYFDITLIPSTLFFFNAHHMKMDSGGHFMLSFLPSILRVGCYNVGLLRLCFPTVCARFTWIIDHCCLLYMDWIIRNNTNKLVNVRT